jgi:hypothetical protein
MQLSTNQADDHFLPNGRPKRITRCLILKTLVAVTMLGSLVAYFSLYRSDEQVSLSGSDVHVSLSGTHYQCVSFLSENALLSPRLQSIAPKNML